MTGKKNYDYFDQRYSKDPINAPCALSVGNYRLCDSVVPRSYFLKPINPKFAHALSIAKVIPKVQHDFHLKRRAVLMLCAELKKAIG